jgi:lipopolysaccharide transport system permease protein
VLEEAIEIPQQHRPEPADPTPRPLLREEPLVVIEPRRAGVAVGLRDLWRHRELLYFMVWRDLKVRYKQTVLGLLWVVMQPLLTTLVFSVFLGLLARVPTDGDTPYPVFVFAGMLPWTFFSGAVATSGNSLVGSSHLITKVYFPRFIVPVSAVLGGLIDFAIAFVILLGMMAYYGIVPTAMVVTLPLFLLLALVTALGVGLWLSALNVQYRDVRYTIGFLTQFWLFATPVAYPSSIVPERWRWLYGLNPMAGVVEGFRWALLGKTEGPGAMLAVSVAAVILIFVGGIYYFRRMERTFADVV